MKLNVVRASLGLEWVKLGVRTFGKQPLAMGGLFFIFMGFVSILSMLPVVGTIVALSLLPAATVGIMEATRLAESGTFPLPRVLATAFLSSKGQSKQMLTLGGMYAAAFVVTMGVTAILDGGHFASMYLFGQEINPEALSDPSVQNAMMLATVLYIPLASLFWHAPALLHWNQVTPAKALFFSAMACWKNWRAMSLFMLGWTLVFVGVAVVVTLLSGMIGPEFLAAAIVPAALLMAAMFSTSIYFTYRDSFTQ